MKAELVRHKAPQKVKHPLDVALKGVGIVAMAYLATLYTGWLSVQSEIQIQVVAPLLVVLNQQRVLVADAISAWRDRMLPSESTGASKGGMNRTIQKETCRDIIRTLEVNADEQARKEKLAKLFNMLHEYNQELAKEFKSRLATR